MDHSTGRSSPARLSGVRRQIAYSAAMVLLGLGLGSAWAAGQIDMPVGGTSWIEHSANDCRLSGAPVGSPSDCVAAPHVIVSGDYTDPATGSGAVVSGEVRPAWALLAQTTGSGTGGSSFLWAATGGLFTLQGPGTAPVQVTAVLHFDGQMSQSGLSSRLAKGAIGTWVDGEVASELNARLLPFSDAAAGTFCSFGACGNSVSFSHDVSKVLTVTPGQAFNLGYRVELTLMAVGSGATAAGVLDADFGFILPEGYVITGSNGFSSLAPVPEPSAWAMGLLGGLLLAGVHRRRARG